MAQASPAEPERPKLVVGIVIDQLRTDYIEYLQDYFNERGFKRLMKGGAYMRDVDFKVPGLDAVNSTAMLYTGTYPSRNGVPTKMVYNNVTKKTLPALTDDKTLGNFTNDSFSPLGIRVSTLSDELAVEGDGNALIYAISTDPQQSIAMAGHAATGALWLNNTSGNWASTTYYKALPKQVSDRNYTRSIAARLDTMVWRPMLPTAAMPGISDEKRNKSFKYTFSRHDREVFNQFSLSPLGNQEVTDLAITFLSDMKVGKNSSATDMLNIGYTLAPYRFAKGSDFKPELTDAYLRLDRQLGRLFDAIDHYVGINNTLIWVSSTGYFDDAVVEDKKYRIPTGEFSMKRATSLLNSYLSALHGNGDYIDSFVDGHLYLDHKTLEDKRLDISGIVNDARTFLTRMSGVAEAFTVYDIMSPTTPTEERLRLLIDPKTGGDVIVTFNPGWEVVDDLHYPVNSKPVRETPVLSPAFIMGRGVKPEIINTPVDAVTLAPTVSGQLRIRSPNASKSKPILLK